jgi:hypothetical protein
MGMPAEIREIIYIALLVDPIREEFRRVCTVDASGNYSWSRVVGSLPTIDEPTADGPHTRIESSVSLIDYSDLSPLARANRFLYIEATPTIYSYADLEYISGWNPDTYEGPTLLHTYLENVLPMTSALYHDLTITDGRKDLSAKDMRILVDLINLRLPNLRDLDIQAVNPEVEDWPHVRPPGLLSDALRTLAAITPLARLTSWPDVSLMPRICFYQALDSVQNDTQLTLTSQPWYKLT